MLRRPYVAKDDESLSDRGDYGTAAEYVDILAKRVAFSRVHVLLCSSILVAGVIEVLWILLPIRSAAVSVPHHPLFKLVEGYVTVGLVGEIALRVVLEKREFCQKWSNVFDVVIAASSVTSVALFAAGLETEAEMLVGTIIVTARVVFRLLRLLSLGRGFQRHQHTADCKHLEVRMTDADDDAFDGTSSTGEAGEAIV